MVASHSFTSVLWLICFPSEHKSLSPATNRATRALWCDSKPANNLDPEVTSVSQAHEYIGNTKELLSDINTKDEKLTEVMCLELGQDLYAELSGSAYVNDFLIPNFYFHLVTAYDILRMVGVPIGKRDYMMHLVPLLERRKA
ncbi:MAG: DUF1993 family protein [Lyngbya sp.]|nr:DUF1993 family protein [Lyngbya sp.]